MGKIYEISLENNKKVFASGDDKERYNLNCTVIVKTLRGLEFGKITKILDIEEEAPFLIERRATKKDYNLYLDTLKQNYEAKIFAQETATKLALDMSFINADFTFDHKQLMLFYTSNDRVDFRELAKVLAGKYKVRIELRQVGSRDKAKMVGGLGPCGRELCCKLFLNKFDTISMAMAKNQNLSLNPAKINGSCGRLLCCLTYENQTYLDYRKKLPEENSMIKTVYGLGKVVSVDVLNLKYVVEINGEKKEIALVEDEDSRE